MSVNKKVLSVAIFGALVSGNAFAANLSAPGGAIPAYFAKEIIATPAAPVTLTTSAAGATLDWGIGYNFSDGEVRYARVECSDNIAFDIATAVTSTAATANIGSINGLGSNVLTFSVTSSAPNVVAADTFTVTGDHDITGTAANVNCSVALYDQPSQAQAGGTAGRIANTVFSGAYLAFVPSYQLVNSNPTTNMADVEASPSYSAFVPAANVSTQLQPNDVVVVAAPDATGLGGYVSYSTRDPDGAGPQTAPYRIDGTPITLADLLSADTTITVDGDFTLLDGLEANTQFGSIFPADSVSASDAVFVVGNTPQPNAFLAMRVLAGELIQESEYSATLNADPAQPTVYAVSDIANVYLGEIVRNGTQLQAPLAQVPGGWISRMVLTNTGSTARAYTIKVMGETGNVISTSNLTGTVPANGTSVVDLNTVLTGFSAKARATLNVTVAGPNSQIQGLYQIVNADSGSISNHVMVRPGTN